MNTQQAEKLNQGDIVIYHGKECRINSIKTRGIAAPHFRLSDTETGEGMDGGQLISHQLVSLPQQRSSAEQ